MLRELQSQWIVGWKNIITESYVGDSHGYTCEETSVGTTNGAGGRNVQLFMIAPDGVVIHALAGFWHPEDLLRELRFARQKLLPLWQDPTLPRDVKDRTYANLHALEVAGHSRATRMRSSWQGFDAKNELARFEEQGSRDTVALDAEGQPIEKGNGYQLKTLDVLVHERMAARPFVPFADFDVMAFADYGRRYYDNNKKVDGEGETFMTPSRVAKAEKKAARQRRRAEQQAAREARRAAKQAPRSEAPVAP